MAELLDVAETVVVAAAATSLTSQDAVIPHSK